MSGQKHENIKSLLEAVPPGFVVDSAWLDAQGIGRRSAHAYVQRGWLERLARGVFRRPVTDDGRVSDSLDWRVCVLSMQHIMGYSVHVGGMTALALQGFGHYLPLGGESPVWLYGAQIPTWLHRVALDAPLETRSASLFTTLDTGLTEDEFGKHVPWGWQMRMSGPERAVMEALDELSDEEGFQALDRVFEGLSTLRPKLLSTLLADCRKIKVRRLFFVFADHHGHAWRKRLDPEEFDLGRGDRALVKGGRIHPNYRIMVPETFARPHSEGDHAA